MTGPKPSAVLMGSKAGAAVALRILLERGWDVRCAVISGGGTHPWIGGPGLEEVARDHGVPVVSHQRDLVDALRRTGPAAGSASSQPAIADFVISYMYRSLVRRESRALARRAAVNFHPAPLPDFAGWAFYNVAILEEAAEYGCTCHHMDDGFDTGPILKVRRFPIDARVETAVSLERRTQEEMIPLLLDFCALAEAGDDLPSLPQNPGSIRYMTREEFERLKEIPAGSDQEMIDRRARAFFYPPYGGAWLQTGEARVEVMPASAMDELAKLLHAGDFERLWEVARRGREGDPRPKSGTSGGHLS